MTRHPHHTARTTGDTNTGDGAGPQLPQFLPTSRTIRAVRLGRHGKPRRQRPWHQLPVVGCVKVVDVLLLGLLLAGAVYINHDLRSTGRQPAPGPAPKAQPAATPASALPKPGSYANGLHTGP